MQCAIALKIIGHCVGDRHKNVNYPVRDRPASMKFNPQKHHRQSIRLRGYNYAQPGAYFITLCTYQREYLFGKVVSGTMQLNEYGQVVAKFWPWLSHQYPYVDLDTWVIMPNHLHGIIVITNGFRRGDSRIAPTETTPTGTTSPHAPTDETKRKPLGRLIGAFKTVSTKQINAIRNTPGVPIWQRNYYEHIIQNEAALHNIRRYIIENPRRWAEDTENPQNYSAD